MFYAQIDNGEGFTFRFFNKADRDQFVADHEGGLAIPAKKAKFVPGADRCVTYSRKSEKLGWCRL